MAFHVKDPKTDRAVRRLAEFKGKGITETICEAVENEYERARQNVPFEERIRRLQEKAKSLSRGPGKPADKAFFDWLSGEEDI
ncbi:MAG TPA: type II toxin-antitoxin system VapB family antitoxin [Rhizomicrobium sp.]|jgi:antitoxin VapB